MQEKNDILAVNKGVFMKELILKYCGGKVSLGEMDSYQVGSSILAFGDFLSIVTKSVCGQKTEVSTYIKGFNSGSFEIKVSLDIVEAVLPLISISVTNNFYKIVEIIKECIEFYNHLKGVPPKSTSIEKNGLKVENNFGEIKYFNTTINNVISNPRTGESLESCINKPTESQDLDHVEIRPQDSEPIVIKKDQAKNFVPIDISTPVHEWETTMGLIIVSPVFADGNKWRFSNGENNFYAEILDDEFLRKVKSSIIRFGSGDTLTTKVKVMQIKEFNKFKIEYKILEVIAHQEYKQHELFQ